MPTNQPRLLVLVGLFSLGCESLLGLNHDYTIRDDSMGGANGSLTSGVTNSDAMGGAASSDAGGSTSNTSASFTTGGADTSNFAGATSAGGGGGPSTGGTTSSSNLTSKNTGGGGAGGISSAASGGLGSGGASTTRVGTGGVGAGGISSAASGGLGSGGVSTTRVSSGGVGAGGISSAASGGLGSGGVSTTRASTGGVGTGGTSSAPRTTGGTSSSGTSATGTAGAPAGGGSNCTACSHAITLQSESATAQRGSNSSSGVTYFAHQDRCSANQVLIGYAGTLRNDVYQSGGSPVVQLASLLAICGKLTLDATGTVTVTPASGLDPRGTDATAGTFSQLCPTDQVIVGFAGHAGTIIDQLGFVCATPQSASSACCCSSLTIGNTYAFTPVGGTGGSAYSESCPSGQVALGQSLYTATTTKHVGEEWVSLFGLLCGTPTPVVTCEG